MVSGQFKIKSNWEFDINPDEAGRNTLIGNPIRGLFCKITVNDVNNVNNSTRLISYMN